MDKKGLIGLIVVVLVLLVVGFFWFVFRSEEECVPATCCHPVECVPKNEAPNCSEKFCSMECKPGTLDCGQGYCEYIDGKCEVVMNE